MSAKGIAAAGLLVTSTSANERDGLLAQGLRALMRAVTAEPEEHGGTILAIDC